MGCYKLSEKFLIADDGIVTNPEIGVSLTSKERYICLTLR